MTNKTKPTQLAEQKTHKRPIQSPLPMREGVCASRVFLPKISQAKPVTPWNSILDFLIEKFPFIDAQILIDRMTRSEIVIENGQPVNKDMPYQEEIFVFYYREIPDEAEIPVKETILFEDEHIIAVDKPHFLAVSPSGRFVKSTLLSRLRHHYQNPEICPIHRLDRETAGIIIYSKHQAIRGAYQALFQERKVNKTYEAIAPISDYSFPMTYESRIVKDESVFFLMKETIGEPNSKTHIGIIETHGEFARYQLKPVSGRQHQLRVHLASLGCPILYDAFYPTLQAKQPDNYSQPLQLLAKHLAFEDPITGKIREFESQLTLNFPN